MPAEGQDRAEHIQQKYGLTTEQARSNRQNLIDRGKLEGYDFNFPDDGRVYNTFNAHRLIHWAKKYDLQTELKLAFFDLYFQQAGNPSRKEELLTCVNNVGLPVDEASKLLCSDDFSQDVLAELQENQHKGISAVPAFIFNNKYLVSGGQVKESFVNVLQELEKEATS